MNVQVSKWGNSFGVRIPVSVAKKLGLYEGSELELQEVDGNFVLQQVVRAEYVLADLLTAITPETLHAETDWELGTNP